MKLLLTSAGITNTSIARAALKLVGLPAGEVKLVFIPTAANVEEGDKGWLIDDLRHFQEQGYASIDIVDIAALTKAEWLPRLESANLVCFGGGNEQYLARVLRTSGLRDILPELLKTRVYMGISAGSMVAGSFMTREINSIMYPDDPIEGKMEDSLHLADLVFVAHLNSPHFPKARKDVLEDIKELDVSLYAPDDNSALKIIDGDVEVVSEGEVFVSKV